MPERMAVQRGARNWLLLAAALIVADQASKLAMLAWLPPGAVREMTGFFNIVLVFNSGAAFSFLAAESGWQRWFFAVLAVAVSAWIVFMLRRHAGERRYALALSLVLGGALGNLIDRLYLGAVVDFLDFHLAGYHWPAFNVADIAISLGAVLLVWDQFAHGERTDGK